MTLLRQAGGSSGDQTFGNLWAAGSVYSGKGDTRMSVFSKFLGRSDEPKKRVRVCVECGMPVEDHKDWCAIFRGQKELAERARPAASGS